MKRAHRSSIALVLAASLTVCAPAVLAQSSATDAASRTLLLEQAQQARARGAHGEAYAFAERAGRIEMTPSVRLFLAQELEALGRFAEALGTAQLCVREADRATGLRLREEIIATCRELVQRSVPRVGRLTVHVPSPTPPGLEVRIANSVLSDVFYGAPYVVSPGTVLVEASAAGGRTFRRELSVAASEAAEVRIELSGPVVDRTPPSATPSGREPSSLEVSVAPRASLPVATAAPREGLARFIGPSVLLGAGAVAMLVAIPLYMLQQEAVGPIAQCQPGVMVCYATEENLGRLARAQGYNLGVNLSFVVGGALGVAGALWFGITLARTPPRERAPSASLQLVPAGLAVVGRF